MFKALLRCVRTVLHKVGGSKHHINNEFLFYSVMCIR